MFYLYWYSCVFLSDDPERNKRVLDDTVVLHNAMKEDSAVYQCEASNTHGSILANINIMVTSECYNNRLQLLFVLVYFFL